MTEKRRTIAVFVLVPSQALLLDVAGPVEVLRMANHHQSAIHFDVRYVGVTTRVRTSIGLEISGLRPLPRTLPPHAMVILAGSVEHTMQPSTPREQQRNAAAEARTVRWLRQVIQPSHSVVSICSGAFLAARAGLLDGYLCTTHHDFCAELASIAPAAKVVENRLYVEDRQRATSAGVTAGIDLLLHLVGRLTSAACTLAVARSLVVYMRRSGTDPQLSPWLEARNHLHPVVHRVQDLLTQEPASAWPLAVLARRAGASQRNLSRLFRSHAGMTLAAYRSHLRVVLARELLSNTRLGMEDVAAKAGFGSTRQLRRAWHRTYSTPPRAARTAE